MGDELESEVDFLDVCAEIAVGCVVAFEETDNVRVIESLLLGDSVEVFFAIVFRIEDACFRSDLEVFADLRWVFRVRLAGVLNAVDSDFTVCVVGFS